MFQKFHETTQMSRVVKNLLATEPIPILQTVHLGTPVISGCTYLYNDNVIKCVESGPLKNNYILIPDSDPSTGTHDSSVSWYDDATHKYLGNYLRYLRDSRSIDLMPYYNCYNATELTDIYLDAFDVLPLVCSNDVFPIDDTADKPLYCGSKTRINSDGATYKFGSNPSYKVVAIPVRFDTTYTIAVESSSTVSLRGIIYNHECGMVKKYNRSTYYSDDLNYTCITLPFTRFQNPFTYSIELAASSVKLSDHQKQELYARQKDLYMIIQIPASSASSIVVLEGNYTQKHKEVTLSSFYFNETLEKPRCAFETARMQGLENQSRKTLVPESKHDVSATIKYPDNLSLLHYNTGISYAFSDRLVEYLLLNVVTELETLSTNISRVQGSLSRLYPSYEQKLLTKSATYGVWDDSIKLYVKSLISENSKLLDVPFDHDGYINKDVESLLSQKGVYVT